MIRTFIDLETTGLDSRSNGVHQIACLIERDGVVIDSLDLKARPFGADRIDAAALDIAGLSREQLESYPPALEAHGSICCALGSHIDKYDSRDKAFFYAYNASFDADFLRAWFRRCGDNYFGSWWWTPPIDIMSLAAQKLVCRRHEMENFKLAAVAAALGIDVDAEQTHDGLYDVGLARQVYIACTTRVADGGLEEPGND